MDKKPPSKRKWTVMDHVGLLSLSGLAIWILSHFMGVEYGEHAGLFIMFIVIGLLVFYTRKK